MKRLIVKDFFSDKIKLDRLICEDDFSNILLFLGEEK